MGSKHLALVAILYVILARLGVLALLPEGGVLAWPPNALVLAALIRFGAHRIVPLAAVVLAAAVAGLWPAFTVPHAAFFGLLGLLEAAVAWQLLLRLRFDPALRSLADVGKLALAGPVAAALFAALIGAAAVPELRHGELGYLQSVRLRWFAEAAGLLILTPVFLGFAPFRADGVPACRFGRQDAAVWATGAVALLALWLLAGIQLFLGPLILFAFVLLAAARLAPRWAALAVAVGAVYAVAVVVLGRSQFGPELAPNEVMQVQQFILTMALMGLSLSTMVSQLREQQARLLALNADLEQRVAQRTAELRRLASVDALTGLANRRTFDERLAAESARIARYGGRLALVLVDIDHFKAVNDAHGHVAGDEVIRAIAERLRGGARETDVVARYGGEEFAVLLPGTSLEQALVFAERVRRDLSREAIAPLEHPISASFGVAELGASCDPGRLVAAADAGLYEAKRAGRNRVVAGPIEV